MSPGHGGFLCPDIRASCVQGHAFALCSLWLGKGPSKMGPLRVNLVSQFFLERPFKITCSSGPHRGPLKDTWDSVASEWELGGAPRLPLGVPVMGRWL